MHCIINIIFFMSALLTRPIRVNYEPMLWYYGVMLMPLIVGIVFVLVLEATVLETSLLISFLFLVLLFDNYNRQDSAFVIGSVYCFVRSFSTGLTHKRTKRALRAPSCKGEPNKTGRKLIK